MSTFKPFDLQVALEMINPKLTEQYPQISSEYKFWFFELDCLQGTNADCRILYPGIDSTINGSITMTVEEFLKLFKLPKRNRQQPFFAERKRKQPAKTKMVAYVNNAVYVFEATQLEWAEAGAMALYEEHQRQKIA